MGRPATVIASVPSPPVPATNVNEKSVSTAKLLLVVFPAVGIKSAGVEAGIVNVTESVSVAPTESVAVIRTVIVCAVVVSSGSVMVAAVADV